MGYFIGLVLLVAFVTPTWLLWRVYQRQQILYTRVAWLESTLKKHGVSLKNSDYIRFCYLTEGYNRAVSEYARVFQASQEEAREAVTKIEAELRDSRSA